MRNSQRKKELATLIPYQLNSARMYLLPDRQGVIAIPGWTTETLTMSDKSARLDCECGCCTLLHRLRDGRTWAPGTAGLVGNSASETVSPRRDPALLRRGGQQDPLCTGNIRHRKPIVLKKFGYSISRPPEETKFEPLTGAQVDEISTAIGGEAFSTRRQFIVWPLRRRGGAGPSNSGVARLGRYSGSGLLMEFTNSREFRRMLRGHAAAAGRPDVGYLAEAAREGGRVVRIDMDVPKDRDLATG